MYPNWVARGIENLIRQYCDPHGNAAWIGVASRDGLGGMPGNGLWRAGGHYETMAGLLLDDGFVWHPSVGDAQPELWLSPGKTGYRAIFEQFARRYLAAPGLAGADVQIDHVFPKKPGALGGMAYVRMLAIPPASNMRAGATLERAMTERNTERGARRKRTRLATAFSIGKATGFVGYQGVPDDDDTPINRSVAQALFIHLRGLGLPPDVLGALDERLSARTAGSWR